MCLEVSENSTALLVCSLDHRCHSAELGKGRVNSVMPEVVQMSVGEAEQKWARSWS